VSQLQDFESGVEPHLLGMLVIILTDPLHLLLLQTAMEAIGIELNTRVVCKPLRHYGIPITRGCLDSDSTKASTS
jgi:Arc/MetJ family transcription regulator